MKLKEFMNQHPKIKLSADVNQLDVIDIEAPKPESVLQPSQSILAKIGRGAQLQMVMSTWIYVLDSCNLLMFLELFFETIL